MKLGDKVVRMPVTIEHPVVTDRGAIRSEQRPMSRIVVYIHPLGRFHLVSARSGKHFWGCSGWTCW